MASERSTPRTSEMTSTGKSRWLKVRSFAKPASAVHAFCRIKIGLEDNKNCTTVTEKLALIFKRLGIQITHKSGEPSVHLSKQGNPKMYTKAYMQERAALRTNPRVQKAICKMWNTEVILDMHY